MTRVLMVCLGNICRSAMAQGILEQKVLATNIVAQVDSAGTSSYHIGEAPDRRAQQKALDYDIDISKQQARQFTVNDFDEFDFIFAMDESNNKDIIRLARNEKDIQKVEMILNLSFPKENKNVPDPYYGGEEGFENVYQLLDNACDVFIKKLKNA